MIVDYNAKLPAIPGPRPMMRRVRRASGMRGIVADPYLTRYTNGQPIATLGAVTRSPYFSSWPNRTMGNYVAMPSLQLQANGVKRVGKGLGAYTAAPNLQTFLDGSPIDKSGGNSSKHDLVVMALMQATNKKRQGKHSRNRGMGDMVDTVDPYSLPASIPYDTSTYPSTDYSLVYPPTPAETVNNYNLPSSIPYLTPPTFPSSSGSGASYPTNVYPATQQQQQNASIQGALVNALAPLANLFKTSSSSQGASQIAYPAGTTAQSLSNGINSLTTQLSARPIASVPLSYGGILLLGGGAILLTSMLGKGRRRR